MKIADNPLPQRKAGFRFSKSDGVVLLVSAIASWWLWNAEVPLWWVLPMVVGHFFLFCNVFLVWRNLDLLWAAVFIVNVFIHVVDDKFGWWPACGWQGMMTVIVISWQIRSPWYHGIGARWLNPDIEKYLKDEL